jgi:hypothetical protein
VRVKKGVKSVWVCRASRKDKVTGKTTTIEQPIVRQCVIVTKCALHGVSKTEPTVFPCLKH